MLGNNRRYNIEEDIEEDITEWKILENFVFSQKQTYESCPKVFQPLPYIKALIKVLFLFVLFCFSYKEKLTPSFMAPENGT